MTPLNVSIPEFEIWSFSENNSILFLSEVMGTSFIAAEKFLTGMSTELPSQVKEMFTVYKINNEPVGVVFPHIEPNTDNEGRIFWIGMHPNFLGTGLGKNLHSLGLYRLKNEFKAMSYLGMTQVDNIPMRNIMASNGCIQNKNTVISLQY
ncbi:GNAT family N-acetyltransferase [Lysinibacillus sp. FJAT-14745]|uniref:GNAT family N-acetyltransferase n=1 Tax=Lysinibacillus sp. FJAT-14745 TaxID=1704289 RepID=UPI000A443D0B|nr:GNAT family N-acetyltransferase [Lysinibacillus sp. FJAT-14745]